MLLLISEPLHPTDDMGRCTVHTHHLAVALVVLVFSTSQAGARAGLQPPGAAWAMVPEAWASPRLFGPL